MSNRLKRLWTNPRGLESRLADAVDKMTTTVLGPVEPSPLERIDRAADEIARHVQPAGRGRYTFPFTDVCVTFVAADAEAQARLDAICAGSPTFRDRVLQRLAASGCPDTAVDVRVAYTAEPDAAWPRPEFNVALSRQSAASRLARPSPIRVELVVTHGAADRGSYAFTSLPIAIGRGVEVRDQRQHLLRVNDVAFIEGADETALSVSRRHARIVADEATGRPRRVDDNSARGTSIIRHGRGIVVPRGSHGLGLQSGDHIVLGQSRILVNIVTV
jgi:hypothetical protein